ncbi:hypothetical protein, partial [Escherichia coli]|uniref:hypothetical protein n=1 Tax=Escherichia coli TaxID=562 RepID=UPI003CFFFDB9
ANLYNANLSNAKIPLICKWSFGLKNDEIFIGCKSKSINQWDEFFNSNETYSTQRGTNDFKQIQACYEAVKAYKNFL